MRIQLSITTHKRPEWCLSLLKQIKYQSVGHSVDVAVFHDRCDSDYSKVHKFCKINNYKYFKTKVNFGKWQFYNLLNLTYRYADTINFDYYISIPDDVILVDNFFNRTIGCLCENNPVVNFFTANIHAKIRKTDRKIKLADGSLAWKNNWIDGCFVSTKEAMKGLFLLEPAPTKARRLNRGTGIAVELAKEFLKRDIIVAQRVNALVEHIGHIETVMHDADRRKELYGECRQEKDPLQFNIESKDASYIHKMFKTW